MRTQSRGSVGVAGRYLSNPWIVVLLGGLWGLALGFLGWFEIQPLALKLATWPIIGIPGTLYTVWEAYEESTPLTIGEYALTAFVAAPAIALLVAIALGGVLYGVVEGTRAIFG